MSPSKPRPRPKPTRSLSNTGRLKNLLDQAQKRLGKESVENVLAWLSGRIDDPGRSEPAALFLSALATAVSRRHPQQAIAILEHTLTRRPGDTRVMATIAPLYDRVGAQVKARDTALKVLQTTGATPLERLRAANMLVRFNASPHVSQAALEAFEEMGRPLKYTGEVLYIALRVADWKASRLLIDQLRKAYAEGRNDEARESPRTHLLWCDDEATNLAVVASWNQRSLPHIHTNPPPVVDLKDRRIRIGYLSSDFREHPTARLINGLLRHHDREQFEVFIYCSGWNDGSPIRAQIESHCDHLHSVTGLDNAAAADLIRGHGIDVLVELNGPTRATRMGILAHRPAPVQIGYLGFPGSVGGRVVDYIIGDAYTIPPGAEEGYPEKIIRIQKTYQVNDFAAQSLPPAPDRRAVGLPQKGPILGMFNAINKVSEEVWSVWMRILKAVPEATLCLLDPGPAARKHISDAIRGHGLNARQRVVVVPPRPQKDHLARLQCIDVMLDPWPYGGHTSTSDALFAGVPVVTLEGRNFASRVSGGLLHAAGLKVLVQPDIEGYVKMVVRLLRSPADLAQLKRYIRETVPRQDIFDAAGKARQLESAYRTALELAREGRPPQHITTVAKPSVPALSPVMTSPTVTIPAVMPPPEPAPPDHGHAVPLILVLGPWSSGTSATAGLLALAGLHAPGPYVHVNDPHTPRTYEMLAFRDVLRNLVGEATLECHAAPDAVRQALEAFREGPLAEARRAAELAPEAPVLLKHALCALMLPALAEVFVLRIVGVLRPLAKIEATRQRRHWPAVFGAQGAKRLYALMFDYLVEHETPFHLLRFSDLRRRPEACLDGLAQFCGLQPTAEQRKAALGFIKRK